MSASTHSWPKFELQIRRRRCDMDVERVRAFPPWEQLTAGERPESLPHLRKPHRCPTTFHGWHTSTSTAAAGLAGSGWDFAPPSMACAWSHGNTPYMFPVRRQLREDTMGNKAFPWRKLKKQRRGRAVVDEAEEATQPRVHPCPCGVCTLREHDPCVGWDDVHLPEGWILIHLR
jgi:hypothetical protein